MSIPGWQTRRIESLIEDGTIRAHKDGNYGSSYPRKHEFGDEGVPFLTAKLLNDSGRIAFEDAPRLGFEKANELTYGYIEENDVLLSHNATIGRVAVVPELAERVLVGTSLTYYRLDPKRLLPRFLAAYFKGRDFQNQLVAVMSHSTRNQVPITAQRKLDVIVPPMPEQKRIADILGSLDDKIDLNRRMNATLEAMARRLFRSWFVDFDPVHAKAALRRQHPNWTNPRLSRQALPNLAPQIAELFPDDFEDSTLGPIPKGWRVKTIGENYSLTMGQSPPGSTYNECGEGIPFFQGKADFTERFPKRRVYCTSPTRFADSLDSLVSVRAPVGALNMAIERCAIGRGLAAVRHLTGSVSYTFYAMQHQSEAFGRYEAEGTVFGSINKNAFESLSEIHSGKELIGVFEQLANPIDQAVLGLSRESDALTRTRDRLLPRLLTGELLT